MAFLRAPELKADEPHSVVAAPKDASVCFLKCRLESFIVIHELSRMPNERLPRASILKKRADFIKARNQGQRAIGSFLLLNWFIEKKSRRQMAVVVSKTLGNAVVRNRLKRRVREAYRRLQGQLSEGLKSVWVLRKQSAETSYEKLQNEMAKIYRKEKLFAKKEE